MSPKLKKILLPVGVLVLIGALYLVYNSYVFVSTDNAQIDGHFLMISARVNGTVLKVLVDDHQKVKKGDVLAQIDTSDYSNAKEAAEAQVAGYQARYAEAKSNFERAAQLLKTQAISRNNYDTALANYKDIEGRLNAAKSQADQANLNESYARIIAPEDGVIAKKAIEVGQFVSTGQPIFGFVSSTQRWVTANLKETDLNSVRLGQPVKIEVDAVSGKSYKGKVESIAPSTGALFSLLPPDNATGNFTKVVQRVPVRIALENLSEKDVEDLQVGLSAMVYIRVH